MPRFWRLTPSLGIRSLSRRIPLELKLPLLMSAVLAVVLTISFVVTNATVRRNVLLAASQRLDRATREIAQVSASSVSSQHSRYTAVGNDSAVRRALRGQRAPSTALRAVLVRAAFPTDSGMPVELWTADGRRLGFFGNDVRTVTMVTRERPELPNRISSTFDTTSRITAPDSMRVSPIYEHEGKVHLWFVQPIRDRGQTIGYITHQRRIAAGVNTIRILQELSGDSVTLYYRNVDGSFWTTMMGERMAPIDHVDSTIARGPAGQQLLYHEERIGATPIMVGMHVPASGVLLRGQRTIDTVLVLSLVLLLVGGLASWAIGRRVARPIGDLTRAVGSIAAGNYEVRVPETGDVDVRRLAEMFNHMAVEIGASRAALEAQRRQAEAASNAKTEFLTTMSHELRTPLNAIGGYVELLDMGLRGPLSELQRKDLARIKASQEHLLGLISGVLDLARVEAGKVTYETANISVDPFLAGLDALIAPQAAAKSVTLVYRECAPDLAVLADREKLRQILLNLLSNAIRHTPAMGRVTLSAEGGGGRVAILIEDTGPGVPADKRDAIFEPFVQLDRSLTQAREGLGLGLAISRDLARGMLGDLVVEDGNGPNGGGGGGGGGARFVLTLRRGTADLSQHLTISGETPAKSAR